MKRNLLFLMLMAVLFPLTMTAEEIMVGTATGDKNVAPFVNSYPNSWLEMVYTAEEIGQACTIKNIAFQHVMGNSLTTNDLRIYLAETTKSVLANKSDWTPESELTLVYSGTNVVIGDEEWESFQLDTPFEYSGEKNLAVVVAKTAGGMQLTLTWACYDATNSVMFTASDTDPSFAQYPTANALVMYSKKAVMKLSDGEEGGEENEEGNEGEEGDEEDDEPATLAAPTNLRATIRQDVPGFNYKYEITMAWDAVEGATGYDVYVNTATVTDYQMGYTNGTAYVAGSDTEGTLEFYVIAFNDETESAPSAPYTITIVDDAVEEMTASFNIYPNPVNDRLYIEAETEVKEVVVYDVYGRQQTTVNGQQTSSIDISNLNSGVYFVKVVTENGETVKRIIKN